MGDFSQPVRGGDGPFAGLAFYVFVGARRPRWRDHFTSFSENIEYCARWRCLVPVPQPKARFRQIFKGLRYSGHGRKLTHQRPGYRYPGWGVLGEWRISIRFSPLPQVARVPVPPGATAGLRYSGRARTLGTDRTRIPVPRALGYLRLRYQYQIRFSF